MMHTPAILVVDDEYPLRTTIADLLRRRGYEVQVAASGEEALTMLSQGPFDLLLVDLGMPGMSGMDVARRALERQPGIAVIILTGHGSLESALEGMHLGIFDYMLKTSSPKEVIARVEAAIAQKQEAQRQKQLLDALHTVVNQLHGSGQEEQKQPASPSETWTSIGDLQISTWRQTARLGDQVLSLTPTEFRILGCLAQQAGQVMTYQQIIRCAQGYEAEPIEAAELVKPHIYHLRQKIEPDPSNPRYILTVRGTGYLLSATPGEGSPADAGTRRKG